MSRRGRLVFVDSERRARKHFAEAVRDIRKLGPSTHRRLGGPLTAQHCVSGDVGQMLQALTKAKRAVASLPGRDRARYRAQLKLTGCQVRAIAKMQKSACSLVKRPSNSFDARERSYENASRDWNDCFDAQRSRRR